MKHYKSHLRIKPVDSRVLALFAALIMISAPSTLVEGPLDREMLMWNQGAAASDPVAAGSTVAQL